MSHVIFAIVKGLFAGIGFAIIITVIILLWAVATGSASGLFRAVREGLRRDGPAIRLTLRRIAASWGEPRNARRIALVAVLFVTLAWHIGAERSLYVTSIVLIVMAWRYDPAHRIDTVARDRATTEETKHP